MKRPKRWIGRAARRDPGPYPVAPPQIGSQIRPHDLQLALYRAGRQADALAAYRQARQTAVEELGIDPAQVLVTTTGGNSPQALVNATALAIGRGELDVAVLVGADCYYTQAAARRHPDRPLLPWTVQPADTPPPAYFGSDRRGTTRAEEERGLDLPIHVFPLFENALRAEAGRTLPEHVSHIGELWSAFAGVAAEPAFCTVTCEAPMFGRSPLCHLSTIQLAT